MRNSFILISIILSLMYIYIKLILEIKTLIEYKKDLNKKKNLNKIIKYDILEKSYLKSF